MSAMIDATEASELLAREIRGDFPDGRGRYGPFGGRYVPETLIPALERLEAGIRRWLHDPQYQADLTRELNTWVGRPTPLSHAPTLSARWGADVWMKREDLAHTRDSDLRVVSRAPGETGQQAAVLGEKDKSRLGAATVDTEKHDVRPPARRWSRREPRD